MTLEWLIDQGDDEDLGEGEGGFSQGFIAFSPLQTAIGASNTSKSARQATHSSAKAASKFLLKLVTTKESPCYGAWTSEMYDHVKRWVMHWKFQSKNYAWEKYKL